MRESWVGIVAGESDVLAPERCAREVLLQGSSCSDFTCIAQAEVKQMPSSRIGNARFKYSMLSARQTVA